MAFKYSVVEKIGTLGEPVNETTTELRLISWNDRAPKYDLRGWWKNEDGTEGMTKGISLTNDQLVKLRDLLNEMDLEEEDSGEEVN